jgi:hypothetical protein
MAWQLLKHGDTHQSRENTTYVPCLEGFAEWASAKALQEVTDRKLLNFEEDIYWKYPDLPLTRAYLAAAFGAEKPLLANVDYTERGWHSLFNVLTHPFLDKCDFNRPITPSDDEYCFVAVFSSTACPEVRLGYSLRDVLSIFLEHPAQGIDGPLKVGDLNFRDFLQRAGKVLGGLSEDRIKMVKSCLNPNATANPCPS